MVLGQRSLLVPLEPLLEDLDTEVCGLDGCLVLLQEGADTVGSGVG